MDPHVKLTKKMIPHEEENFVYREKIGCLITITDKSLAEEKDQAFLKLTGSN
jgi:hypothetical protein